MIKEEAIVQLKMNRDLCNFNPMTGEEEPMNEDCRKSAEALDMAIKALEQEPTTKNNLGVDCISRQATINALKRIHPVDTDYDCTLYDKVDVMYVLDEMPSVTPQEPCEDSVSRQEVINTIFEECSGEKLDIDFAKVLLLQRAIKALQSVTPTRKKGKWINKSHKSGCGIL